MLAVNRGKLLTHRALLQEVWGPGYGDASNLLHVNVSQLRRKIEPDRARPRYLLTEPGAGYRLVDPWGSSPRRRAPGVPFAAGEARHMAMPTRRGASSTSVIASRLRIVTPSAAELVVTAISRRVHRGLAHAEPRRREHDEHGHDRADRGRAAEERDRGELGAPATLRIRKKSAEPADQPGAAVEGEQAAHQRERERLDRGQRRTAASCASISGPKMGGWRTSRATEREQDERLDRRVRRRGPRRG